MNQDKILLLLLLVSLTLYLYASFGGFVHYDESAYVLSTMKFLRNLLSPLGEPVSLLWPDGTDGPVFIYLESVSLVVLSVILKFPVDTSARIIPVMMGVFNIFLLYVISRKLSNSSNIALTASALYAFFPISVFFTHLALAESTVVFFMLASIVLILTAAEKNSEKLILLGGLVFGLGLATKLTIAPSLLPVFYLMFVKFRKKRMRSFLFFLVPLAVLQVPFLIVNLYTDNSILNVILGRHSAQSCYFDGSRNVCDGLFLLKILECGLTFPLLIVLLISLAYLALSKSDEKIFILLWFAVPFLYLLKVGEIFPRYTFPLVPPAALSIGYLFVCLIEKTAQKQISAFFLAVVVLAVGAYSFQNQVIAESNFPISKMMIDDVNFKPNGVSVYKSAAQFILSNSGEDDAMVLNSPAAVYVFLKRPAVLNWVLSPNSTLGNLMVTTYHKGYHDVKLNGTFRYMVLEGKDFYELKENYSTLADTLKCLYNITQDGKMLICVALNPDYAGPGTGTSNQSADSSLYDYVKLYRRYGERIIY